MSDTTERAILVLVGVLVGTVIFVCTAPSLSASPSNVAPPAPVATDSQWTRGPDMGKRRTYEYHPAENIRCYGIGSANGMALSCVVLPTAPAPSP